MAHSFDTNSAPATGAIAMYKVITTLVAAGWTKVKDSDGSTYSSSGVQITGSGGGANGLANTSAWFVMRDPNSVRQFCWQRGSTNLQWRLKYSASAGFTGGSPSATQVPSATDEIVLFGTGTDAAPTTVAHLATENTYRWNVCAGDSTIGHGFYYHSWPVGNPVGASYGMHLDVMAPGSFPASDTDPAIIYLEGAGTGGLTTSYQSDFWQAGVTQVRGFLSNTHVAANFVNIAPLILLNSYTSFYMFPAYNAGSGVGVNPFTSKDDLVPIAYGRPASQPPTPCGFKGFSSLVRWVGTFRAAGDTISSTGANSRDFLVLGPGAAIPWDGSVPVI